MKYFSFFRWHLIFSSLFLLLLLVVYSSVFAEEESEKKNEEKFFSSIYHSLDSTGVGAPKDEIYTSDIDLLTATIVAALIGVSSDDVLAFIYQSKWTETMTQACTPQKTDIPLVLSVETQTSCQEAVRKLWNKEKDFIEKERFRTQTTGSYIRWWDGYVVNDQIDFDILFDLEIIEKQFDSDDIQNRIPFPESSSELRQNYSLAEYNYRLPANSAGFESEGGCEEGETSLYGGFVCVPEFCSDYMCVKVESTPGRRASPHVNTVMEATFKNIVRENAEVCLKIKDTKQKTPTHNTSIAHYFSQKFDWDQLLKGNIYILPKVPPIIEELVPNDYSAEQKRKQYTYGYDSEKGYYAEEITSSASQKTESSTPSQNNNTESSSESEKSKTGEEKEQAAKKAEILKELNAVREEFGVCKGKEECMSEDLLTYFDCGLASARAKETTYENWMSKCSYDYNENKAKILASSESLSSEEDAYLLNDFFLFQERGSAEDLKAYLDDKIPQELSKLWKAISTFQDQLSDISLDLIEQAGEQCGNSKNRKNIPLDEN